MGTKGIWKIFVALCFLFAGNAYSEELKPAPSFRLINSGYGSAALGLGGAFVAIADDLSAMYWNPAGVGQLTGLQIYFDYKFQGDSDEDFSEVVSPDRFDSLQRYEVSGNSFQSLAVSYEFKSGNRSFVPAFSWQKIPAFGPEREMKDISGMVRFLEDQRLTFIQSEGIFQQDIDGGEEEFSFGFSARVNPQVLVGGNWNLLRGGPEETLTGTFHDSFVSPTEVLRTDLNLTQNLKEEISGNYFRFGVLFLPTSILRVGSSIRFPYTRKSDLSLEREGPFTFEDTIRDVNGNVIRVDTGAGNLQEQASAETELDYPLEFSVGLAVRATPKFLLTGSLTYSEYGETVQLVLNSTNPALIPETTLPYPTLRAGTNPQDALMQWRGGVEYIFGAGSGGFLIRSGFFYDGQPYGNTEGDTLFFKGYSFGAGVISKSFRVDAAFISEEGDLIFSRNNGRESNFKNRKFVIGVSLTS